MSRTSFPQAEKDILEYWQREDIFIKTLQKESPCGEFVFYEGPPTANGKPGIHHMLARSFKDVIPRYKTMQGYHVSRKGGWDTHGLPVELQVEKQLGISGKPQIEDFGVAAFNQKAKESVWEYKEEWERFTRRMGYWIDLDDPYITYENDYIESVWHILQQVDQKGLLYQGHKVVPHCPRCGTALSSHEVAQGYKEVKDISVYVKFGLEAGQKIGDMEVTDEKPVYILSWTTTPWTLPGNVGLAVGEEIDYVVVKVESKGLLRAEPNNPVSETLMQKKQDRHVASLRSAPRDDTDTLYYIIAKALLDKIEGEYEILEEFKGKDLVGLKYHALFPGAIPEDTENYTNAYKVWAADFVTTADGTGVVHTAVMYGEDDYQLGEQVGLPRHHTVNTEGKFDFDDTSDILAQLKGMSVKHKDPEVEIETTKIILRYLAEHNILFKKEKYTHDYPFCWRCDTPLLYYAKDSWFIQMSAVREQLIANNKSVNWIPEYIKDGRFGQWLEGIKDWAVSRERYWGTPLPIWRSEDGQYFKVVGSRKELFESAVEHKPTRILAVRHGKSEKNTQQVFSSAHDAYPLTDEGMAQAAEYARVLNDEQIDVILCSSVLRARQTAEVISAAISVPVTIHEGLCEENNGQWEGKNKTELTDDLELQALWKAWQAGDDAVLTMKRGRTGESYNDVTSRTANVLQEIVQKYSGKTVLIVGHGVTVSTIYRVLRGYSAKKLWHLFHTKMSLGCPPHEFYLDSVGAEFDLHKPMLDDVVLSTHDGMKLYRDKGVLDVWFDSGAMPYAQWHYPFEHAELIDSEQLFPADYISEAIDQTRGWFYTLLAVATLLDKPAPYKNVICLAHINDKHGKKMSKSKGNIVDPWEMMETYGADAVRMLFYTMNQPGESKNFDPGAVEEIVKKNWLILSNVFSFYEMFADNTTSVMTRPDPSHTLDQWVLARTDQLLQDVTQKLDAFDVTMAGRAVIGFIQELSTIYVQYSRDRFKDQVHRTTAAATLGHVLYQTVHVLAPFAPFLAEGLYQRLQKNSSGNFLSSIHLSQWPESVVVDTGLLEQVATMEQVIEQLLAARAAAGVKVRQPLSAAMVTVDLPVVLYDVIAQRVNLKTVTKQAQLPEGQYWQVHDMVALNIEITDELKKEGVIRELTRHINQLRKQAGLTINDRAGIVINTESPLVQAAVAEYGQVLYEATLSEPAPETATLTQTTEVTIEAQLVRVGIIKS